jgi:outer membrane protein assembly complex protein YaeT
VEIRGAEYFDTGRIKDVMRTKESRFLRKRRLKMSTLESDLISIEALYRRNGFLEAAARVDTLAYDDERENVCVAVAVEEGPQTVVQRVVIEGNSEVETEVLRSLLETDPGDPLDTEQVGADEYELYTHYADRGYVFASVSNVIGDTDGEAVVKFTIDEGRRAEIGRVRVEGNRRVSKSIIRREITLKPGEVFSRKKVLDSKQRLYDTGFFRDVGIQPRQADGDSARVDLLAKVKERKMREVSVGIGYGTREETRLTLGWLHRNLWNSGSRFEVRGIVAARAPEDFGKGFTDPDRFSRKRLDVTLLNRWFFGRRLIWGVAFFGQDSREKYNEVQGGEYTLIRIGGDLSVEKEITRSTKITLSYTHEFVDVREPNWGAEVTDSLRFKLGQEFNRSVSALVDRDTRRPFFDPVGGSLTRMAVRVSGGILGGDNSYAKATWSWSRYLPFYRGGVLAVGTRVGGADAFGQSRERGVPEYERFFAGGSSTIRGYDEREFGPGNFLLLANAELRYRVLGPVVGVVFFDMGNVWPNFSDVEGRDFEVIIEPDEYTGRRSREVKYSAGIGLGIQTPVGPARLDYGIRIKRGLKESGGRESLGMLHFTVGHAF